MIFISSIDGGQ